MSIVVPPVDLAPSLPSRIVTVRVTDLPEGGLIDAPGWIEFVLPGDLRVPGDDIIVRAGSVRLNLDASGEGRVRLPVHNSAAQGDGVGGDWYLLVRKSWTQQVDMIRVPAGSGSISLADIAPVVEVTPQMGQWLITGAGVQVVEGSQWGATVTVSGGVATFRFTVPPGGESWTKGNIAEPTDLNQMRNAQDTGVYSIRTDNAINGPPISGNPLAVLEVLRGTTNGITQRMTTTLQSWWRNTPNNSEWSQWRRIASTTDLDSLTPSTRGDLPANTDLDLFVERDQAGSYGIPSSGVENGPPITSGGVFEVWAGTSSWAKLQRVTTVDGLWWRKHIGWGTGWGAWQRATTDAELQALSDQMGQLLSQVPGMIDAELTQKLPPLVSNEVEAALADDDTIVQAATAAVGQALEDMGEVTDPAIAAAITAPGSASGSAVEARALPALNAHAYGATGDGVADDSAAWSAAIEAAATAGGGVVTGGRGRTYVVTGLPIRENVYLELDSITLLAPAGASTPMFIAPAAQLYRGGIRGGTLDGRDKANHGLDFSASGRLHEHRFESVLFQNFDRAYVSSGDDRFPVFHGCRFWFNNHGMWIINNHPVVDHCDFRSNDVGIAGNINDWYVVGSKFNYNRVGIQPRDSSRWITNSTFIGCMFFRNSELGIELNHGNRIQGCMFVGGGADDVGVRLLDQRNTITGNYFGFDPNGGTPRPHGRAAIEFAPSTSLRQTLIDANQISIVGTTTGVGIGAGPNVPTSRALRHVSVSNNHVWMDRGRQFVHLPQSMELYQFAGNQVYIGAGGAPTGAPIIDLPQVVGSRPGAFMHNTFGSETLIAAGGGAAIRVADGTDVVLVGNMSRFITNGIQIDANESAAHKFGNVNSY